MNRQQGASHHLNHRAATALLILGSLFCLGCPSKPQPPGEKSGMAADAGNQEYPKTNPPSAAPVFRWDFSKANVVRTYAFTQTVRSKTDLGASLAGRSHEMGDEMSTHAVLLIKSQGDGTAELVMKDLKTSITSDTGAGDPTTMEHQVPALVLQGLQEDGSDASGNRSRNTLFNQLFPLPSKSLKVGESADIPIQKPFNAMGSVLNVKGRSRIALTQYVTIGGRTCARFDVDTDVSELNVPVELKGQYQCSTKGSAVLFFDVANRTFVSGTMALHEQVLVDAPAPQMKIPGEDVSDGLKRTKISMTSDTLIRFQLQE